MFFRRRGCLLGCSVLFALCVGIGLLGWFVVIPRIAGVLEDGLSDGMATSIAEEINPLYSRAELQNGQDVRFSFDSINQSLEISEGQNPNESLRVTTSGDRILIQADFNGQEFEVAFVPEVTNDGRFQLDPVEEENWITRQIMDIVSGGFEGGINNWLELNGLYLINVSMDGDGIILTVEGE